MFVMWLFQFNWDDTIHNQSGFRFVGLCHTKQYLAVYYTFFRVFQIIVQTMHLSQVIYNLRTEWALK